MGYRDDLYRPVHIIGYTGVIHELPSVYFYNPQDGGFGHITQAHGVPANIGRGMFRNHADYRIENRAVEGGMASFEFWGGNYMHRSRNPFIPVCESPFFPGVASDFRAFALLAPAIRRFTEIKPLALMGPAAREAYFEWLDAQAANA